MKPVPILLADDDNSALGCGRYWSGSKASRLWPAPASNVWTMLIGLAERFPRIAMDIAVPDLAGIDATELLRLVRGGLFIDGQKAIGQG